MLTLDRFSIVQVNLEIGGSSICWFSTVAAGSAGTTGMVKERKHEQLIN